MMSPYLITSLACAALEKGDETRLLSTDGVILFARNFQNPTQLETLVCNIRTVNPDILICVDQEGGRVQRFKEGFTPLPPCSFWGQHFIKYPSKVTNGAYAHGYVMAYELLSLGVDLSLGPVLDLNHGKSRVMETRSFASEPKVVCALAGAMIAGMKRAGMATVGKHFPGHGFAKEDTHNLVVKDLRDLAEMTRDLEPYRALVNQMDAVMLSHIIYPTLGSHPASLSPAWVRFLQSEIGFKGLVLSDDLCMQAAVLYAPDLDQRLELAEKAGVDVVLICDSNVKPPKGFKKKDISLRQALCPRTPTAGKEEAFYCSQRTLLQDLIRDV